MENKSSKPTRPGSNTRPEKNWSKCALCCSNNNNNSKYFMTQNTSNSLFYFPMLAYFRNSNLTKALDAIEQNFHCGNHSATLEQLLAYVDISWWLDFVCQTSIASLGVFLSLLVLPILFSTKRIKSVFNCLVALLVMVQTLFIIFTLCETLR